MGEEKKNEKITNSDGHVLTEAEIRRQAAFDEKEKKLLEKGYKRQDIVISVLTANFVGILLTLPFVAAIVAGYILRNGKPFNPEILDTQPGLYFAALAGIIVVSIILTVLHEKIHGWFWTIGAENGAKDIEFGFQKETLTPYCTCASPLSKSIYILGSMMPMTILGVILGVVSIFVGFSPLLFVAVIQTIGGAGDILISAMLLLRKTKDKDVVLLDHPTKIGLVAFEKEKEAK
ncbi:MAG: DUF3267 domain-containing protein [Clostridiales bacterium]|nr:DUF3267 domain-containing protein [Clostridiales bacterium]